MADNPKANDEQSKKKRSPISQTDLPSLSLTEALRVPLALRDEHNLQAASPLDVGLAVGIAPTSGSFRTLTGAAIAYGLTTGGYNATEISLTDLGRRIAAPQIEGDDVVARREAFERPRIVPSFLLSITAESCPASRF